MVNIIVALRVFPPSGGRGLYQLLVICKLQCQMTAAKCVLNKVLLIPQSLEVLHRTGLRNFDFYHQNFTLKIIQGNEHSFLAYFWKIQHLVNISSLPWARSWPAIESTLCLWRDFGRGFPSSAMLMSFHTLPQCWDCCLFFFDSSLRTDIFLWKVCYCFQ